MNLQKQMLVLLTIGNKAMKKVIIGLLLVGLSLANSLNSGTNFVNAVLCMIGGFLFITGALKTLDKVLQKFNDDEHD